jgi:catechol 2,3-dioxygenase-like lactoylglutathione lyase family enzyme
MTMRTLCAVAVLVVGALGPGPADAQLAPPNNLGVRVGHIHLAVKDVEAQRQFWTTAMGGTVVRNGPLSLIQFPGVFIMLRQAEPSGPPAGSIVDHFGFVLKDLEGARARWKAAGIKYDVGQTNPNQGYVYAPDGIRVEVFGDPSLPGAVSMDHIHTFPPAADVSAMQRWYATMLGGLAGTRQRVATPGVIDCVYFHRFNVSFSPSETRRNPTKGRALDHLGFDVRSLDETVSRLEAGGATLEAPPRQVPNTNIRIAFLTDPWGTYIELTENLAPPGS